MAWGRERDWIGLKQSFKRVQMRFGGGKFEMVKKEWVEVGSVDNAGFLSFSLRGVQLD